MVAAPHEAQVVRPAFLFASAPSGEPHQIQVSAGEPVQSPVKVRRQAPPPQVLTAAEVAEYKQSVAKEAAHPIMHRRLGAIIADIKAAPPNQRNPLIQEYLHAVSDLDPAAAQAAMRSLIALWKRG